MECAGETCTRLSATGGLLLPWAEEECQADSDCSHLNECVNGEYYEGVCREGKYEKVGAYCRYDCRSRLDSCEGKKYVYHACKGGKCVIDFKQCEERCGVCCKKL